MSAQNTLGKMIGQAVENGLGPHSPHFVGSERERGSHIAADLTKQKGSGLTFCTFLITIPFLAHLAGIAPSAENECPSTRTPEELRLRGYRYKTDDPNLLFPPKLDCLNQSSLRN
jgi:hypothetical protein